MIVFDLDGTLRNNKGSQHHVPEDVTKAANWVQWQQWVNKNGTLVNPMVALYNRLHNNNCIAVVTSSQFGTREWLHKNGLGSPNISVERNRNDNRNGFDYKKEFIDNYRCKITLWVDDDAKVCDYVESLGIPVVRVPTSFYEVNNT